MIDPTNSTIGWIGTGMMGVSICGHLISSGYGLTVHSRTKTKVRPLLDRGADWAGSQQIVAGVANIVVTIVCFPADVRNVYFVPRGSLQASGRVPHSSS